MKIAVPDLITNSYFPAIAAVELGFCQAEGLDLTLEHIFPVPQAMAALRDGQLDFVAGSAHATLTAFPVSFYGVEPPISSVDVQAPAGEYRGSTDGRT